MNKDDFVEKPSGLDVLLALTPLPINICKDRATKLSICIVDIFRELCQKYNIGDEEPDLQNGYIYASNVKAISTGIRFFSYGLGANLAAGLYFLSQYR